MNYDIFKNDEERRAAINHLEALKDTEGWRIVERALDINLEHFNEELRTEHFIDLRPVERLQDRVADLYKLKQLPILLMKDAEEKLESPPQDHNADPYDEQSQN